MSGNRVNPYGFDPHLAEIYDQQISETDDVTLLLRLINGRGPWNIFEPFCGTGRIALPLIKAGHQLTGMDQSPVLLERFNERLKRSTLEARVMEGDVTAAPWPGGFDLVVMGVNCLYELATSSEQEGCICAAAAALKPGGYLFLDNDHMEGDLALSWQDMTVRPSFPSGICADGVRLESTRQLTWFDASARLARFERITKVIFPDGRIEKHQFVQQKHPVSTGEVRAWLQKHGFVVEMLYGNRDGVLYTKFAPRAIFWARKI